MPVFRSGEGLAPAWCEMERFETVRLKEGGTRVFERAGRKEKLVLSKGRCAIAWAGQWVVADGFAKVDLFGEEGRFEATAVSDGVELTRLCGRWVDRVGGSGLFAVVTAEGPSGVGSPVAYARNTVFDNHYHDCDEYWVIIEGRGTVMSEGRAYAVGPGDCVATGMGHHHDFPRVSEPVRGVYFETTMEGRNRPGHLWTQRDGEAEPVAERV